MIDLKNEHPAQLTLGAVIIGEEFARLRGQMVLETIFRDAAETARETTELLREIATDADYLLHSIEAAATDGIFDTRESRELIGCARSIREEAESGVIQ